MSDTQFGSMEAMRQREELDKQQRQEQIRRGWEAYYGWHPAPLKNKPGKPDDNLIVNYCRLIVDVGVSFLFGEPNDGGERKELSFTLDGNDNDTTDAEQWLRRCWRANRKMTTLQKIGLNGAIARNSYVKLMQADPYPRIVVLDPATVEPFYDPNDIERVLRWRIEYEAVDPVSGKPMRVRQLIEQGEGVWQITDQRAGIGSGSWETTSTETWNYPWSPIHHCQNLPDPNSFWGVADLEDDVIKLNFSSNFVLSNINRILRYHAHPKTWGKGFRAKDMQVGADETIVLENEAAQLNNLEMVSDLTSSTAFHDKVRASLRETSHIPEVALGGIDDASRVSSLALKVLYGPLLMHTGRKRATYGEMLWEVNSHLLELAGYGAGIEVHNQWPYVLPQDPQQEAQTLLIDQQLGASKQTTLRKRGYDPTVEADNRDEEGESMGAQLLRAFDRGNENA